MKKAIVSVSVCLIMAMVLSTGCQKAASVQSGAVDKPSSNTFWYDKIKEKYGGQGYDDTIIS